MMKTLNLNVLGTPKGDVAPKKELTDFHLLETTPMPLLLLSMPGQPQRQTVIVS